MIWRPVHKHAASKLLQDRGMTAEGAHLALLSGGLTEADANMVSHTLNDVSIVLSALAEILEGSA